MVYLLKVETRGVEFVPVDERHGKAKDLFPIWFGANMHITTLVTGALPISLGLNLFWSFAAIILGTLLGAIFMASHSAQGPKLGIPQMIQSRAQFGVIGAIFPLFLVMFVYLGFFASSSVLAAQTLNSLIPFNQSWAIIILNILCFIVAIFGYDVIHKMQKVLSWSSFIVYLAVAIIIFQVTTSDRKFFIKWLVFTCIFTRYQHCSNMAISICTIRSRLFTLSAC